MKLSLPLVFIKSTSGKYTETRWDLKESNSKTFKKHDTIEITYQISLPKMILWCLAYNNYRSRKI